MTRIPTSAACLPLALALGACTPSLDVEVPAVEGARSLLLFARSGDRVEGRAFDLLRGDGSFSIARALARSSDTELIAVSFDETLEELQLADGRVEPVDEATATRHLPRALAAASTTLHGSSAPWATLAEPPLLVRDLPITQLVAARCAEAGGCVDHARGRYPSSMLDRAVCTIPCPAQSEPLAPEAPSPPLLPEPPDLLPCPAGWTERPPANADDVATCDPPTLPAAVVCGTASAQYHGEGGCAPIGSDCPQGQWSDDLETGGAPVSFVLAGAAPGGTGTRAQPFARIADALAAAPPGGWVAIGTGTYAESLLVPGGVTVVGACVERTILAPPPGSAHGLQVVDGVVALRGLQLRGAEVGIVASSPGTRVELDGVLVDSAGLEGVKAQLGAQVFARELVIRRRTAFGVRAVSGAHMELERSVLEEIGGDGASASDPGTSLSLRSVALRDGQSGGDGSAHGVIGTRGADLELAGVTIERAHGYAVAWGEGARGVATDLHVEGVTASAGGEGGSALFFGTSSSVEASRASVSNTTSAAVLAEGAATTSTLTDVALRPASPDAPGVEVRGGARLELGRARVEQAAYQGLGGFDVGSSIVARDLVVRDGFVQAGHPSSGVALFPGARLELDRAAISHLTGSGVRLATATASLRDLVARDLGEEGSNIDGGDGIFAYVSGVSAERILIERVRSAGFGVYGAVAASISDVTIRTVRPGLTARKDGLGLVCTTHCRLRGARVSVADTRKAGFAAQRSADVSLEDLEVVDTAVEDATGIIGNGVLMGESTVVHLTRAAIRRSAEDGIYSYRGNLEAQDVLIEGSGRDGLSADTDGVPRLVRAHISGFGACGYNLGDSVDGELTDVVIDGDAAGAMGDVCLRDDTTLVLDHFRLTSTARTGLTLAAGNNVPPRAPTASLKHGVIAGHVVGIAVLDDKAILSLDLVELQANDAPLTSP